MSVIKPTVNAFIPPPRGQQPAPVAKIGAPPGNRIKKSDLIRPKTVIGKGRIIRYETIEQVERII